jgi:aminoglycoside phosphotransferase (APT) family kinase protein
MPDTHQERIRAAYSEGLLEVTTLRAIWAEMRDLPRGDTPDVMNHGDLIPPNILVAEGRAGTSRSRSAMPCAQTQL